MTRAPTFVQAGVRQLREGRRPKVCPWRADLERQAASFFRRHDMASREWDDSNRNQGSMREHQEQERGQAGGEARGGWSRGPRGYGERSGSGSNFGSQQSGGYGGY